MIRTFALIAKYGGKMGLVLKRAPFVNPKINYQNPTIVPKIIKKNVKQNLPKLNNHKNNYAGKKNEV